MINKNFKNLTLFIIVIVTITRVNGDCNQTPLISLTSDPTGHIGCMAFETLYVNNPQSFTSLSVDGYVASVDSFYQRIAFYNLKAGPMVLKYSYLDSVDYTKTCNGSVAFTANPHYAQVVQQPKCPFNNVQVMVYGDTSTTFSVNSGINLPLDQLYTTTPGNNVVQSSSGCTYYFEVMPESGSVPLVTVTPNTCGKNDSMIKVSNYASYTSLTLVNYTNSVFNQVNGVFTGLAPGSYILNASSTACGIQVVNVTITNNIPTANVAYSPLPCGASPTVNATFSVPGYPNANFSLNGLNDPLVGTSAPLAQNTMYTIYWSDSVSGCSGSDSFTPPISTLPLSYTLDPPVSSLSQPSVITLIYQGNYSDLSVQVNSNPYPINNTHQIITNSTYQYYVIHSNCYVNPLTLYVPVIIPHLNSYSANCVVPGSITVNYPQLYSNVSISMDGGPSYWTSNGSFPSVAPGHYNYVVTEKVPPGITAKTITGTVFVATYPLSARQVSFEVEYITKAPTCKTPGTVRLTPIFHSIYGDPQNVSYTPNTNVNIPFSSQCTQTFGWTAPFDAIEHTITYTNATVNNKASFNYIPDASQVGTITVENSIDNGQSTPLTGSGPYSLDMVHPNGQLISNYITVTYQDGCTFPFVPNVYAAQPDTIPSLTFTDQRSDQCHGTPNGAITINNPSTFVNLYLQGVGAPSQGVWSSLSGNYSLFYQVGYAFSTMNLFVPSTDLVALTMSIINPTCSSSHYNGMKYIYSADSYITFNLFNKSSNAPLPITGFTVLTGLSTNNNYTYYNATNQLIGLYPGNYSGSVSSWNCNYLVNFTVTDYIQPIFTFKSVRTPGTNGGVMFLNNPENRYVYAINDQPQDSSNFAELMNNDGSRENISVSIQYNTFCSSYMQLPIDFSYPVQPSYQLLPSGKCGSQLIQFTQSTIDNYNIIIGNIIVNSTTPLELMAADYTITYTNINNFVVTSDSFTVVGGPSKTIQYTYIPATCEYSTDGRVIINNPDPTLGYTAILGEGSVPYNNVTHSFDNLDGYSTIYITASVANSKGSTSVCDVASVQIANNVQYYLIPTLKITNTCADNTKGNIVIGSVNSTAIMNGTFIINGTTYTNSSIDLPPGYYQMTIPQMTYGVCTFNQGINPDDMESAVIGVPSSGNTLEVFNFQITKGTPIFVRQLASQKDNCGAVTVQGSGGSGNYTFELYYQSNNTLISTQVSVNGLSEFNVTADSTPYKLIAKDQSSCMTSTISINGDCQNLSFASTLSISSFFILFITIISLIFVI